MYAWMVAALLGAAGFLIDLLPVSLAPGTDLVFGGVMYLMAAAAFGAGPGLLAGAIASAHTLWRLGHPIGWLLAGLEAAAVGLLVRRWALRPLVADMVFWLLLGVPLLFLTDRLVQGISGASAHVVFLKHPFNGMVCALAAEGLLLAPPVRRAMRLLRSPELRSAVAVTVTLAAVLPALAFGVWMGRQEWNRNLTRAQERAALFAQAYASKLEQHVQLHEQAIGSIARTVERAGTFNPELLQHLVRVGDEQHPGFASIYAANAEGRAVAFHPLTNAAGDTLLGLDFSDRPYFGALHRTRAAVISDVFAGRGGAVEPVVAIIEPIVLADTLAGFAAGALNLRALPPPTPVAGPGERLRIADARGTLIYDSHAPYRIADTPRQLSDTAALRAVLDADDVGIAYYPSQDSSTRMLAGIASIPSLGWRVWLEQPISAVQAFATAAYIRLLTLLMAVTLMALLISDLLAGLVAAPLRRVNAATAALAAGEGGAQIGALPAAVPAEIQELARGFDEMSAALAARTEELEELGEITRSLALTLDPDDLLRRVIAAAVRLVESDGCGIALLSENGQELAAAPYSVGLLAPLGRREIPLEGSLIGWVVRNREAALIVDARDDVRVLHSVLNPEEIASVVSVPLLGRSGPLGTLTSVRSRANPRPFRTDELRLIERLARTAALAVENARLFEAARAASHAKSDFIATISHELRTPLNAVLGYVDLLLMGAYGEVQEKQRETLSRVDAASRHLQGLIEEVLSFARMEAGRAEVTLMPTDLNEIALEVAAVIQPLAAQKALAFETLPCERKEAVLTDAGKVRQILINLAGNAVKFTDRGSVRLSLEPKDGEVWIRVEDTGPGIPASARARLFRPFEQLESGPSRAHSGTGLGLYLSGRYAELLGGRIEVESEVGRGSIFTLVLPHTPPGAWEAGERMDRIWLPASPAAQ